MRTIKIIRKHMGLWYVILVPVMALLTIGLLVQNLIWRNHFTQLIVDIAPFILAFLIISVSLGWIASEMLELCEEEKNKYMSGIEWMRSHII